VHAQQVLTRLRKARTLSALLVREGATKATSANRAVTRVQLAGTAVELRRFRSHAAPG